MGIYDREYYRREGPGFLASLADSGKVCMWLIAINAVIFVLQLVTRPTPSYEDFGFGAPAISPITDWLMLDTTRILQGQVWRILTGAFLHNPGGFWAIVFNMLFLWWFGHEIENIYGSKEFLAYYLGTALLGNVAFVAWQLITGEREPLIIGASGPVMAILVLFALHYPQHRILVMWLVPVPIWLFVLFMVGKDAYIFLASNQLVSAVTPTLTAAGFGYLYYRRQWRVLDWVPDLSGAGRSRARPKLRVYRGEDVASEPIAATAPNPDPPVDEHLEAQLDAVLDKMNRTGKESLTESEREILMRAAEVYKRRRP